MKSIYPIIIMVLFIAALGAFALGRAVEIRTDPPPRHDQPDQDKERMTTADDIQSLSCLEIKAETAIAPVLYQCEKANLAALAPDSVNAGHQTPAVEPPPQRRFGERPSYWRSAGWQRYGWQRFAT